LKKIWKKCGSSAKAYNHAPAYQWSPAPDSTNGCFTFPILPCDNDSRKEKEVKTVDVGEKIRTCRMNAGMKQGELAEKLHVTPQAVSNWERNKCLSGIDMVPDLAEVLGITYKELLNGGELLNFYSPEQKVLLLRKCIDHASVANRLCTMLDRWAQEGRRIHELENEELRRRGVDISSPFISLADVDPLGLANEIIQKKHDDLNAFIKENGTAAMRYVLMILYLGEDLAHGAWELPDASDPEYIDSVCDLLLTDQDDYHRLGNPYYEIIEKRPELVAEWVRSGLIIIIQAV
jgi:transcriptional regulator with XRE-family HTH domain